MYEDILDTNDLRNAPHRIFNCDETGFNTDARSTTVFVDKRAKDAYHISPTCGKTTFTVLFCVSAAGIYLPPFVVYKSQNIPLAGVKVGLLQQGMITTYLGG